MWTLLKALRSDCQEILATIAGCDPRDGSILLFCPFPPPMRHQRCLYDQSRLHVRRFAGQPSIFRERRSDPTRLYGLVFVFGFSRCPLRRCHIHSGCRRKKDGLGESSAHHNQHRGGQFSKIGRLSSGDENDIDSYNFSSHRTFLIGWTMKSDSVDK